jgi:hypothetical protein
LAYRVSGANDTGEEYRCARGPTTTVHNNGLARKVDGRFS